MHINLNNKIVQIIESQKYEYFNKILQLYFLENFVMKIIYQVHGLEGEALCNSCCTLNWISLQYNKY